MHPFSGVFSNTPASIEVAGALRLFVALIFGALGGLERQWHHKIAGVKTNTLVAVGAAAFALVSSRGLGPNSNTAQIAAGVVSGIGFIGAGVIMRRSGSVQGINTAANLWATAGMGLAIGGGYFILGATILLAILATQVAINRVGKWIDGRAPRVVGDRFTLTIDYAPTAEHDVETALGAGADRLVLKSNTALAPTPSTSRVEEFRGVDAASMQSIGTTLAAISGVTRVEWVRCEASGGEHESA
jgi:putative Mg2+ transporter-C (MgtC) family protein